jgi:hypothetical protein
MYRTLKYTVVTAVAAAALATSPALAKPLTGGAAAPQSLHPDSSRAHYRDLFYRTDDAFTVRPIPTTPAPAQPRPVAETPPAEDGDTNGALLIGLGLAGAGVVVGAAGAMRRRRVAV